MKKIFALLLLSVIVLNGCAPRMYINRSIATNSIDTKEIHVYFYGRKVKIGKYSDSPETQFLHDKDKQLTWAAVLSVMTVGIALLILPFTYPSLDVKEEFPFDENEKLGFFDKAFKGCKIIDETAKYKSAGKFLDASKNNCSGLCVVVRLDEITNYKLDVNYNYPRYEHYEIYAFGYITRVYMAKNNTIDKMMDFRAYFHPKIMKSGYLKILVEDDRNSLLERVVNDIYIKIDDTIHGKAVDFSQYKQWYPVFIN